MWNGVGRPCSTVRVYIVIPRFLFHTRSFGGDPTTLSCKTMLLVGDDSPHLDDVTAMNATLNPSITSLVKVSDCGGLILEEQPEKVRSRESRGEYIQKGKA